MSVRVRFAPSPTGYLHVGGARAVLFNWLFARQQGGEFLLRIEDTDTERNQPELVDDILRSIEWLGLGWDGEPVHQADRRPRHLEAAEQLVDAGVAFWSGWQPAQGKGPPERRATDRAAGLGPSEGRALRFRVPDGGAVAFADLVRGGVTVDHDDIEDFVLVRANGTPVFLLANAVDDADMGITHVLRGEEHLNGTPKYLLIQEALGLGEQRPTFAHLPILVDEHRKKLSKRKHAVAVSDFRERGILPEAMVNYLGLLGWGPPDGVEVRPLDDFVELFRLEDVTPSPAFFDERKLEAINGDWIRLLDVADFVGRADGWLDDEGERAALRVLAPLAQSRVRTMAQLREYFDWVHGPADDPAAWAKATKLPEAAQALDTIIDRWATGDWKAERLHESFIAVAEGLGVAARKVDWVVRVAVTGRAVGLPLFDVCEHLGRDETLARLREARAKL